MYYMHFRQDRVYYHICSINVQIGKTVVAITAYFIKILNPVFLGGFHWLKRETYGETIFPCLLTQYHFINKFDVILRLWKQNYSPVLIDHANNCMYIANEPIQILKRVNFSPLINTLDCFWYNEEELRFYRLLFKKRIFGENCSLEIILINKHRSVSSWINEINFTMPLPHLLTRNSSRKWPHKTPSTMLVITHQHY